MRRFNIARQVAPGLMILTGMTLSLPPAASAHAPVLVAKAPVAKPPHVSTGGAGRLRGGEALLQGTINPNGSETGYYFQYGTTTAYGAQTAPLVLGSSAVAMKVGQPVSGLQPGVVYHYRLIATSSVGSTLGQDRTFIPAGIKLKFNITKASSASVFGRPTSLSGTLSGTGSAGHEVVLQASPFPFTADFANFGSPQLTAAAGNFSFPIPSLTQSTQFRVITLDTLPVFSPVVTSRVAVRVSLRVRTLGHRGLVRLYGTVSPSKVNAPVVFQWLKPGGRPVGVARTVAKRATASSSRFSSGQLQIRPGRGGSYRAFVQVPAGGAQVSGYSPVILVRSGTAARKGR